MLAVRRLFVLLLLVTPLFLPVYARGQETSRQRWVNPLKFRVVRHYSRIDQPFVTGEEPYAPGPSTLDAELYVYDSPEAAEERFSQLADGSAEFYSGLKDSGSRSSTAPLIGNEREAYSGLFESTDGFDFYAGTFLWRDGTLIYNLTDSGASDELLEFMFDVAQDVTTKTHVNSTIVPVTLTKEMSVKDALNLLMPKDVVPEGWAWNYDKYLFP